MEWTANMISSIPFPNMKIEREEMSMSGFSIDHIKRAVESVNRSGLGTLCTKILSVTNEEQVEDVELHGIGALQEMLGVRAECRRFKK